MDIFKSNNDYINILNFAIEREKEAIIFYQNLKKNFKEENIKDYLNEIIEIEKTHIIKINSLKNSFNDIDINKIKIENKNSLLDFLKTDENNQNDKNNINPLQELILLAIKKENSSYNLYIKLSETFKNLESFYKIFLFLANEELSHKKYFEDLYEKYFFKEF